MHVAYLEISWPFRGLSEPGPLLWNENDLCASPVFFMGHVRSRKRIVGLEARSPDSTLATKEPMSEIVTRAIIAKIRTPILTLQPL